MKNNPNLKRWREILVPHPHEYSSYPKLLSPILIKAFWLCLGIYLAILPIYHTTALRNLAFAGLIACTLILQFQYRHPWQFPLWREWLIYALVALASLTYAIDPKMSLFEIKTEIVYAFIVFSITATWIRSAEALDRLMWAAVAANICLVISSVVIWLSTPKDQITLLGALNIRSGTYSTYLVTVIPFVMALAWRQWCVRSTRRVIFLVLLLLINVCVIFFTRNRQSFPALMVECAIFGLISIRQHFTWRRVGILLLALVMGTILFKVQFESRIGDWKVATVNDVRWQLWGFSIARIGEHPFSGAGFGREAFALAYPDFKKTDSALWHSHNMVLNKGIQMGLPGIAAFLLLLFSTARLLACGVGLQQNFSPYVLASLAMLAGVFMKNMTDDFFVRDGALLFWLLVGAVAGAIRCQQQPSALPPMQPDALSQNRA
jgi:O-Antigen ligase